MDIHATIIEPLDKFVGVEHSLDEVNYALKFAVRRTRAPVVAAHHITCSDESERECVESFQRCCVQDLVPRLKFGNASAFRTANVGGRYEWNSLPMAESHYATLQSHQSFKVMIAKINAHVSVVSEHGVRRYGRFERYGADSPACGALYALLDGSAAPFADELREQFASEGLDRRALLLNEVPAEVRSLSAAIVSARLQARSAAMDVQEHRPVSPTVYLIVPTVTLNHIAKDAELMCGIYVIDRRTDRTRDVYRGLGDNPAHYQITDPHQQLHVTDLHVATTRTPRDHRQLVAAAWRKSGRQQLAKDPKIDKLIEQSKQHAHGNTHVVRTAAKALLTLLADLSPVSAALLLFAEGASGIYQVHRAHRLVRDVENTQAARAMLADVHARIDHLPPDQARKVLEVLLQGYKGS